MGTKRNPGPYDCYANAHPDEPMFILLGRDPLAPMLVRQWALMRLLTHQGSPAKVQEARACANAMDLWRVDNAKPRDCGEAGHPDACGNASCLPGAAVPADYAILSAPSFAELAQHVSARKALGWRCLGGVVMVADGRALQTMERGV